MKKLIVATLAICLYYANGAYAIAPLGPFNIPAECKNLAVMQAELLRTVFHSDTRGAGTYNPADLSLQTNNGFNIGTVAYLGGDSEDQTGPNAGKYPCDLNKSLCTALPDAGGAFDWARVTVTTNEGTTAVSFAEVVVSVGSRGGCIINAAKYVNQN